MEEQYRGGTPSDRVAGTYGRKLVAMDPWGAAAQEVLGNGLVSTSTYLATTGQLLDKCVGISAVSCGQLDVDYSYDGWGNVTNQTQGTPLVSETYGYDALHRLLSSQRAGTTVTQSYQANGNLSSKSDFSQSAQGSYAYAAGRPHAVSEVIGLGNVRHCYAYDGSGNQLTYRTTTSGTCGTGQVMQRTMTYEVGHRPETIAGGIHYQWQKLLFRYDGAGDRYIQRQYVSGSPTQDSEITLYPFAGYEVELQRSGLSWAVKEGRQMLGDWGLWRASVTLPQGSRIWRHGDRLGSPVAKSDEIGVNLERHGFDAWGAARQGNGMVRPEGRLESAYSPRGFTGHEHLDAVGGVIHMNGRGYDANLGRFLSVDPIIQFPANSQSLNPYSYILNNPLSGTDPTGYCVIGTRIGSRDCKEMGVRTIHVNPPGSSGGGSSGIGGAKSNGGSSGNGSPDTHSRQATASRTSPQASGKVPTNAGEQSTLEVLGADTQSSQRIRTKRSDITVGPSDKNKAGGYRTHNGAVRAQFRAYDEEYREASSVGDELLGIQYEKEERFYFSTMEQVPPQFESSISIDEGIAIQSVRGVSHMHPGGDHFSGLDYSTPAKTGLPFFVRTPSGNVLRWEPDGAFKYQQHLQRMESAQRGLQRRAVSGAITDHARWGISSICAGGAPCLN